MSRLNNKETHPALLKIFTPLKSFMTEVVSFCDETEEVRKLRTEVIVKTT